MGIDHRSLWTIPALNGSFHTFFDEHHFVVSFKWSSLLVCLVLSFCSGANLTVRYIVTYLRNGSPPLHAGSRWSADRGTPRTQSSRLRARSGQALEAAAAAPCAPRETPGENIEIDEDRRCYELNVRYI